MKVLTRGYNGRSWVLQSTAPHFASLESCWHCTFVGSVYFVYISVYLYLLVGAPRMNAGIQCFLVGRASQDFPFHLLAAESFPLYILYISRSGSVCTGPYICIKLVHWLCANSGTLRARGGPVERPSILCAPYTC